MDSIKKEIIKRILSKCRRNGYCVELTTRTGNSGYSYIYIPEMGAGGNAHRLMWFVYNGFIPDGKLIMHTCDNRLCINPRHLKLGDDASNMKDMWDKGRGVKPPKGEDSINTKFKDSEIVAIRHKAHSGISFTEIAKEYKIHPSHVSRVARGLIRKEAGGLIIKRLRRVYVTGEQREEIFKHRKGGSNWEEISSILNLSRSAVMRGYKKYSTEHMKTQHPESL